MEKNEKRFLFRQKKVKNQYVEGLLRGLHKGAEIGGGNSGEGVNLEELTVTKNGVYEPKEEVKLGGTYTFKEDLGNIDFEALFNAGMDGGDGVSVLVGGEYSIILRESLGVCVLGMVTSDFVIMYITQELKNILIQDGAPVGSLIVPGWVDSQTISQVPTPTVTIPETEDNVYVSLSLLSQLFETEISSNKGFNKVTVDVTPNTEELIIYGTEDNYTVTITTDIEKNVPYIFKKDLNDADWGALYAGGAQAEGPGRHLYGFDGAPIWLKTSDDYGSNPSLHVDNWAFIPQQSIDYYGVQKSGWYISRNSKEYIEVTEYSDNGHPPAVYFIGDESGSWDSVINSEVLIKGYRTLFANCSDGFSKVIVKQLKEW